MSLLEACFSEKIVQQFNFLKRVCFYMGNLFFSLILKKKNILWFNMDAKSVFLSGRWLIVVSTQNMCCWNAQKWHAVGKNKYELHVNRLNKPFITRDIIFIIWIMIIYECSTSLHNEWSVLLFVLVRTWWVTWSNKSIYDHILLYCISACKDILDLCYFSIILNWI